MTPTSREQARSQPLNRYDALLAERAAERLAPIYEEHGWVWEPIERVPTAADLRSEILERIQRIKSSGTVSIYSGRLMVEKGPFSDETGIDLRVYLEVAHSVGEVR